MSEDNGSLKEGIKAHLIELLGDSRGVRESVDSWMSENSDLLEMWVAVKLKRELDRRMPRLLRGVYGDLRGFHKRLLSTWKAPLRRFDALIHMCREVGDEINREYRSDKKANPSTLLEVATRLQARAVLVASEVSCLLKGGFADGAMGRWRSLHETAVTLAFVAENGEGTAQRFLDYQDVLRFKAARKYNAHCDTLGFKRVSDDDIKIYEGKRDAVLNKYGKNFGADNGWASNIFERDRVHFSDIEERVELDYLRPQYGFASQNVHSGVDIIGYKLGLSMSQKDILLAGPSNEGLIEPIQCSSYSLIVATSELIGIAPSEDRNVMEQVLWLWHESVKREASEAWVALEKKGGVGAEAEAGNNDAV